MTFRVSVLCCFLVVCTKVHGMTVDLYVHKDKFGQSLEVDVSDKECTNVPRPWANLTQSIDTHGSCMQFYDEKSCRGRIAVIQPFHAVHQMDLSLINFDNAIESISPCGPKVQSGRYVIQSAVDASILTVSKTEGQFASAQTLPPRPFIPKAQQWDIEEKQPHEYDVMPRIHEENFPVTYDGDAMRRGSFIRKRWKIESVGRGRYIIRSEWTQKCLYKTRLRRVEENDCRSWSPSQEWVLRPLLTRPKPEKEKPEPELTVDGINSNIPSRVVDEHLAERRKDKDQEERKKKKKAQKNNAAYLAPYRIYRKKPHSSSSGSEELDEDSSDLHPRPKTKAPPKPQVLYTAHGLPLFGMNKERHAKPNLSYINGVYPIFDDTKVEDPVFPDFLLNTEIRVPQKTSGENEFTASQYKVTRRPISIPYPNLPNVAPPRLKYSSPARKALEKKQIEKSDDSADDKTEENDEDDIEDEEEDDAPEDQDRDQDAPGPPQGRIRGPIPVGPEDQEQDSPDLDEFEQEKDDDPTADVASFLKLLFKGISTKMNKGEKNEEEMIDMFE